MPDESAINATAHEDRGVRATRTGRRWIGRAALIAFLTAWVGMGAWHVHKPLPPGVRTASAWQDASAADVRFLRDVTAADAYGHPIVDQQIFDRVFDIVGKARHFIVLDFFLFNDQGGALASTTAPHRPLSRELTDALIRRHLAEPDLKILFITDPINDVYGGDPSPAIAALRSAGIDVVITDLDQLPDSNPVYSALWRLGVRWWSGDGRGDGWLPNPLDTGPSEVTFRAWARLFNLKANHRKVIVADDGAGGLVALVTSANPHDASSAHSNVALEFKGPAAEPLLRSEIAVARFSGWMGFLEPPPATTTMRASGDDFAAGRSVRLRTISEGAIREAVVERVDAAVRGDAIDLAMFYLADRSVIESLIAAAARGVNVRILLDPNKDAFGREKSGIPNREVASELVAASDGAIKVRWFRTHGEQFHTKLVAIRGSDRVWLTLGSANLTRRNVGDYNLEANVAVEASTTAQVADDVSQWFDTLWHNRAPAGTEFTANYDLYADPSQGRYWLYRIMESTGLSTF